MHRRGRRWLVSLINSRPCTPQSVRPCLARRGRYPRPRSNSSPRSHNFIRSASSCNGCRDSCAADVRKRSKRRSIAGSSRLARRCTKCRGQPRPSIALGYGLTMLLHARAVVAPAVECARCLRMRNRATTWGQRGYTKPGIRRLRPRVGRRADAVRVDADADGESARSRHGREATDRRVGVVGVDGCRRAGLGRVRLEPVDDNPSHFALVAIYSFGDRKDEATLVLPEGRRVVRSCSRARRAGAGCPLVSPRLADRAHWMPDRQGW